MSTAHRTLLIVFSVLALINVTSVPIFEVWGGLVPTDVSYDFFDVMEMVSEGEGGNKWVVLLTMTIFVPTVFMFIMSFVGHKGLFLTADIIGILLWFKIIIEYCAEEGFEDLTDFEDGSVSIGTWFAIILYLLCLTVALSAKSKKVVPVSSSPQPDAGYYPPPILNQPHDPTVSPDNSTYIDSMPGTRAFCPSCGNATDEDMQFCGHCGHKL